MNKSLYILIFVFSVLFWGCRDNQFEKFLNPLGNYFIANSPEKDWYIASDISEWYEYNRNSKKLYKFDIYWYSPVHFDLKLVDETVGLQNKNVWVECRLKKIGLSKVLEKKANKKNNSVKAVLKENAEIPVHLKKASSLEYQKMSVVILQQLYWLKKGDTEKFFEASSLNVQLSYVDFKNFYKNLHSLFGSILWFRAINNSFRKTNLGYEQDIQLGMANSQHPVMLHLQWNSKMKIVNLAFQSGKLNQPARVKNLLKQYFQKMQKQEWSELYNLADSVYKLKNSFSVFKNQMLRIYNKGVYQRMRVSSIEADFVNYGKQWAYYFEVSLPKAWVGISFKQNFDENFIRLEKFVWIE